MHRQILLSILVATSLSQVVAQRGARVAAKSVTSSSTAFSKLYFGSRNEPPRAIEFNEQTVTASYFQANVKNYLNVPSEFAFTEVESNTDHLGMRHRVLQQYYKGIPVEGMVYRVHENDGFVRSANGRAIRDLNLNVEVTLSEEQAFRLAVEHLHTSDTIFRPGKKLIVSKDFTFAAESFSVAFQFDISVSLIEQWRISVDARTGQVLNKVSLVNTCSKEIESEMRLPYGTGTGLTNYYGTQTIRVEKFENGSSRLVGQTEHGGIIGTYNFQNVNILSLLWFFEFHKVYDFYSSDNTYNSAYLKPAVSVQWAVEKAYEYYFNQHDRNSFDNNGSAIKSYVHVDNNMNNAFWTHNLLAFGDGDNNNPPVELDVVSHELTHGVTQFEAGLSYYNEPGALNESFSDIFGKAIEFSVFGDTATWQFAKHNREGGFRDLSNPNFKGQPDTYLGDMWYTGYEDFGGVHYNSGVQNFWFYLLCEGGNGVNDHQVNYSVNPIGMDAATKIAYRNLTEYLSYSSDYLDSRIGSMLASADLYGKNSAVYQEVDKAWDAVGVIDEPIITSLELYDITATTVKIKGSLLPRGDTVTYHFEYGTTPAYGSSSPIYQYTDKVEGILTGLLSETKYYLRLVATNENGNSYDTIGFTTISLAPLVKIKQTVDVTETTATLYGRINPNSLLTSFYFEYGQTPALGLVTPSYQLTDTTEYLDVSTGVINLEPRKTYYYKLIATNSFASASTDVVKFFTAVRPVIISQSPTAAPPGTEVTLSGYNFNISPEKNLVDFGATRAVVLSSNSTEIKVKVPAGASFGPISLLDAESGLMAESSREFVPTFTGEFKKNTLTLRVAHSDFSIYNVSVQDMDGDNKPDIVGSDFRSFMIFQNVSQGGSITSESFIRNTYNVPDFSNIDLYVVDLDGNGLKDVIGRYQYGLLIYPNFSVPGYIFFGTPVNVPMEYLEDLTFKDFDLDGHIDIAGMGPARGVKIIRNQNPKGSLSPENFVERFNMSLPDHLFDLSSEDLNNDGKPEFIVGVWDKQSITILKNSSQPNEFEFEEIAVRDSTMGRIARYRAHDLNLDGLKDIISYYPYGGSVGNSAVLENKSGLENVSMRDPFIIYQGNVSAIQPADINGDSKVDLIPGIRNRTFLVFENKAGAAEGLSTSSFEKIGDYGVPTPFYTDAVDTKLTINDLNGDGRPDVIAAYSYSYGPHDGYQMEIWQHAPANCPDPSLISVNVSDNTATIVLPPNTTLDQFQIEYTTAGNNYWNQLSSTTFYVSIGYSYQVRARAKCYLGFTDYYYINFVTDCVNTSSFSVTNVGINSATLFAYNLYSLEIQCSQAGLNQWQTIPNNTTQITNLLPGTTYDIRYRGRCYLPAEFKYKTFTTLCVKLSSLLITNITHNKAEVNWTSNYTGNAIIEYSSDNTNWTLVDETGTIFPLIPGKQYYVRGRLACTNINSDFSYTSFVTPCPKLSLLNADHVMPFSARIYWADEANINSYSLEYSIAGSGSIATIQTSSTSFTLEGLSPGTLYSVAVAAQCEGAKDYKSMTFVTVCYKPFDLKADAISQTTAELSWNDDFSGYPYSIDYSVAGSNVWLTAETPLTNISLTKLRPGTRYEARVHITCRSLPAPYASLHFETNLYGETTFAPNPTDHRVTIYPSKDLIGNQFSVHDNAGRKVAGGEFIDYTIDLSMLEPGIYVLKINGDKPMKIIKH